MKKFVRNLLLNTKVGKFFMKSLSLLNTAEGIIHLIVSFIGIWGIIELGDSNAGVWTPIIENFVFGVFSILTGWALNEMGHSHHGHHHKGGE